MRRGIFPLLLMLLAGVASSDGQPPPESVPWIHDGLRIPDKETYRDGARVDRPPSEALQEALALAKKEKRMVLWYAPRIAGRHMYRAQVTDRYTRIAFFHHPDIVHLIRENYVPLRAMITSDLGEKIGISAPDVVEPAILFLSPEGEILHRIDRIRTWHPDWFLEAIRAPLLRHKRFFHRPQGDLESLIRAGRYEDAKALEPGPYHRAILARRTLQGPAARWLLRGIPGPEAAVERGRVLLGEGDLDAARRELARFPDTLHLRWSESLYYLGVLETWAGRDAEARTAWERLVREDPGNLWSRMAAAELEEAGDGTPSGPVSHLMMSPFREPADRLSPLSSGTVHPHSTNDVEAVIDRAIDWLLRAQRADGGWKDARYAYWPGPEILPNVHVAVSALCAEALLAWKNRRPERIGRSVEKSLVWLGKDSRVARGINEEVFADLFRLRLHLLLLKPEKDSERRGVLMKTSGELLTSLRTLQDGAGFWGHEYPNPFVTAAVLRTLLDAGEAGLDVPETVLEKAADALISTRGPEGTQAYMAGRVPSLPKDSAGRMPLCESVLVRCGRLSEELLPPALANFRTHRDRLERVRTCDFHTDGQLAGFFFWFDLMETAETICHLPEETAVEHRQRLIDRVCSIPEMDGSFIDSHEMGKSYGTAAALLTLRHLMPR